MRALVLEGGGMRGTYTSGVLEAFSEEPSLEFDLMVACSAGACAAASLLAGQPERNRRVYLDHLAGGKFVRWSRLFTGGSIMDVDHLTDQVTVHDCPLDLTALKENPVPLYIGVTDAETGQTRYLNTHDDDLLTAFRATCALPLFYGRTVSYRGRRFVDGGVGDPVPVRKAAALGASDLIVVLTSSIEDRTRPSRFGAVLHRFFSRDDGVRRAMAERPDRYREAASFLASPPQRVRISVVRPSRPLDISRATRDRERLRATCDLGYEDGRAFRRAYQESLSRS